MKIGFDSEKYEKLQSQQILERVEKFSGRLYLEFGGKLFDDLHASRVLPGFRPDSKVRILQKLSKKVEIIMVISSGDIERKKVRADYGITYDQEVIRQIERLRKMGLTVSAVVITMYNEQKATDKFVKQLQNRGENVYLHTKIDGYPEDVEKIVSKNGFGKNPYINVTKPIIVVTAPGPGSGKMATCLNQLYHESLAGKLSGYAKFETFPIWNLPVDHPVNLAYEAATADLNDKNLVDTHHLRAYHKRVTNYNRDIESFSILKAILNKITGDDKIYCSPTDMGVNMAGYAISNDKVCSDASINEIIRRYYKALCDYKQGNEPEQTVKNLENLIRKHDIEISKRRIIKAANDKYKHSGNVSVAIELDNSSIVCGRETELLTASSSAVINCLKEMAGLDDEILLLSEDILKPICELKRKLSGDSTEKLGLYDVISALAICSTNNLRTRKAYSYLDKLAGSDAHCSHMIFGQDLATLKSLKINISCEPEYYDI